MNDVFMTGQSAPKEQTVVIKGGGASDGAVVDGADSGIKATVKDLTNANPLTVAITDGNGDQITSFGGGTQYTEGDTDTSITGTALMWEDTSDTLVVASATKPIPVSATLDTTGLATEAKQDTIITHVDGVETVLGTIDADTSILAGAVTAGKVQAEVTNTVTVGSHNVTNAGTFAVQVTSAPSTTVTATQLDVDNLNATDDVVTVTGGAGQTADVKVTLDGESVPVTGTFYQATQPVSIASAVPVTDNDSSLTVDGTVTVQDGGGSLSIDDGGASLSVENVPHIGLNGDPFTLQHEGAQYTTQQTSTVLIAGGASEKIVVTQVQIQSFGTTAFSIQLYFGTGAYARGTNRAIFDGDFAPSATNKAGVILNGPFISGTNGDDLLITTSTAGSVTVSVWYYVVT